MMRKKIAALALLATVLTAGVAAQKSTGKSWTEWTKKDAEKVLNDSPWGQTQTETDTSEMFFSPTTRGGGTGSASRMPSGNPNVSDPLNTNTPNSRTEQGALNTEVHTHYYVRWLSAKPIRRALAREIVLNGGTVNSTLIQFANGTDKRAVIGVSFDSTDQRFSGRVMQAFNSAVTATLRNNTYLELQNGTRVFLSAYISPTQNALGTAMFVFPRTVRETPLLTRDSGEVRFVCQLTDNIKLDRRFKVSDMIYEGRLEY